LTQTEGTVKTIKSSFARTNELVIGYRSRWIDLFVDASFSFLSLTRVGEEARIPSLWNKSRAS